jgi:hypothetical protein
MVGSVRVGVGDTAGASTIAGRGGAVPNFAAARLDEASQGSRSIEDIDGIRPDGKDRARAFVCLRQPSYFLFERAKRK